MPSTLTALAQQGEKLYLRCGSCHSIAADGPQMTGPNLHDIFGSPIGARAGYQYSPALAEAKGVWTPERLDAWLEKPRDVFPGNKMAFAGLPKPEDRAAIIAYLQEAEKLELRGPVTPRANDMQSGG